VLFDGQETSYTIRPVPNAGFAQICCHLGRTCGTGLDPHGVLACPKYPLHVTTAYTCLKKSIYLCAAGVCNLLSFARTSSDCLGCKYSFPPSRTLSKGSRVQGTGLGCRKCKIIIEVETSSLGGPWPHCSQLTQQCYKDSA